MSDETIQYITTDYLIEVDGGEPAPAPIEYIVELGQVGVQGVPGEKGEPGFSPTVGYILNDNTFKINITNQDGITQTPNLYDYFADKNGYLKINGSNAVTPFWFGANNDFVVTRNSFSQGHNNVTSILSYPYYNSALNLNGLYIWREEYDQRVYLGGDTNRHLVLWSNTRIGDDKEIATVDQIPDISNKLNTDGSNANNGITLNGISLYTTGTSTFIGKLNNFNILQDGISIKSGQVSLTADKANYAFGKGLNLMTGKVYYSVGDGHNSNDELAVKGDIPTVSDATITLTQGGVTKGTFTLNGSATTIDLDAGGSTITNPLAIGYTDGSVNYNLNLGINETTSKIISSYTITSGGSYFGIPIRLLNGATSPLTLTEDVNGLYGLSLNIDDTTIKVNQQTGELYAVGGGGTTYTAGTGIDITSDVISVEDTQEFDTVTLANTIGNNGEGLYGTIADGSSTLPLVRIDSLDNALFGNTTSELYLFGDNTRPYYNNSTNTLALSSDIPTNSDYVDLTTDQNINGTKAFTGTLRLISGSTVIRNSANTGNVGAITSDTTSLIISTPASNRNINLKPNGTGEVQYNGNKIATINDIPSISNLADKDLSNLSATGQDIIDGKANTDLSNITTVNTQITTIATNPLVVKVTGADITTAPSANIDIPILYKDNNNNDIAAISVTRFANGNQSTGIVAANEISGTNKVAYADVYVDSSGDDHFDASVGARKSIAQMFINFGTSYAVSFDASGNFTPTTNGFLQVSVTSVGSGSIGYLSTAGLNISIGSDNNGYVAMGVLLVQAGVVCHIDLFGGAYVSSATFIPNGRA